MPKIEVTGYIQRPPDRVFAYMTDSSNRPKWDTSMVEMKQTSAGPKGVGTTYKGEYQMIGGRRQWTASLTKYDLNSSVGYAISSGNLRVNQDVTLSPTAAGTKLSFAVDLRLNGLLRVFSPIMRWTISRQTKANIQRLKQFIES
jgi:hypothetical protein